MTQDDTPEPIQRVIEKALALVGYGYLEQESALRSRAAEAAPLLRRHALEASDAFERFVAATLAEWVDGRPAEFAAAMTRVSEIEKELKGTPASAPKPAKVERTMTSIAGDRLVDLLALRLIKRSVLPGWLEVGALLYLREHPREAILAAVERYAAETQADEKRQLALEIVAAIKANPR